MRLAKIRLQNDELQLAAWDDDNQLRPLDLTQAEGIHSLHHILEAPDPLGLARYLISPSAESLSLDDVQLLPPIDAQEVWAAGVTYKRSQVARMEESETAASHYDKVYSADRPELFFKSTAAKVVGPGQPVRVRFDSQWSVPEPELALVVNSKQKLVALTIGNDMSARDIEGENPLYLPQAKVYHQSCALGPCLWLYDANEPLDRASLKISLKIERDGATVFEGQTDADQLARSFEDLVSWLYRENEFPQGAVLLTGTGVVPDDDFSLEDGDDVAIEITPIGTLFNPVVKSAG